MQVIREKIGETHVLIETMDAEMEVIGAPPTRRNTKEVSISSEVEDAYRKAKSVIRSIAEDIGDDMGRVAEAARPSSVELEFSMGFSSKVNSWVLTGQGEFVLKVKLKWEP